MKSTEREAPKVGLEAIVGPEREALLRMIAAATAHRACCGTEHDALNGKLHGYCVVCGVPWPCETAENFLVVGRRDVPANCRQRLVREGKPYPRSSCAACGQWSPRHRECDVALSAKDVRPNFVLGDPPKT